MRAVVILAICVVSQSLVGCEGVNPLLTTPTPPSSAKKYLLTSSNQSPVAGSSVTITAQLVDSASNTPLPIAGRVVSWRDFSTSVRGSFASQSSTTDVGGKATVAFTTSTRARASHRILATDAEGTAGSIDNVTTIAGPPAKYNIFVNAAVALAGNTVSVYAYLVDVNNNVVLVSGRVVTWTSSGTGGSLSAATSSTNSGGGATVNLRTSATGGVTHVVTAIDTSGIQGSTIGILTVAGAQGIVAQTVVVGSAHSCVLDNAGMPSCWGSNGSGELGNGFKTNFPAPVPVSGTLRFVSLAAGSSHTCGISNNGEASCWGSNSAGQLGNNSTSAGLNPTPVSGSLSFVALTAGNAHTCGIVTGGAAYCWGDNNFGQLGTGTTTTITRSFVPLAVQGGLRFVSLSAGADHTCGVVDTGRAYCWGNNQYGQVGNGSTSNVPLPTAVNGGLVFSVLSSGGSHTCGVAADGTAYCWGENSSGQLGDGSSINSATPSRIAGAQRFTSLSAGFAHTCGLEASGVAYCWGLNSSGELGNGTVANRVIPSPVAGNLVFASLAAGGGKFEVDYYFGPAIYSHTCGVTVDRTAYCWGYNGYGELGDNSPNPNPYPVKVAGQR